HPLNEVPGDVAAGHVAVPTGPDGDELFAAGRGRDVDQAVREQGPDGAVHAAVVDAPDFPARGQVVGGGRLGARTDDLRPGAGVDHGGRAVALHHVAVVAAVGEVAVGLPHGFPGGLVERGDVLNVVAVEDQDQQVAVDD